VSRKWKNWYQNEVDEEKKGRPIVCSAAATAEIYNRTPAAENPEIDKNSSGDEIANVNFLTTISHTYFKIPKKRQTYFI